MELAPFGKTSYNNIDGWFYDNNTGEEKMKMIKATKRYVLINRKTGSIRRGAETRQIARDAKRTTERIYDTAKSAYIR